MTYSDFKNKYNGKGIDFDGWYGYQCMDLAHQYATEVVGIDFAPAPAAKDVWKQNPMGYEKIPNTPDGVPQQGDIIVWGTEVGPYGHIAVFDNGDVNKFQSFDQNWPVGSLCHIQDHNYKGVLGWFRPYDKIDDKMVQVPASTFEELVTKATKWDDVHPITLKLLHDNEEMNKQKDGFIAERDKRINELERELVAFIERNEELASENDDILNTNEELTNKLEACEAHECPPCPDVPNPPENPPTDTTSPQKAPLNRFLDWIMNILR